MSQTAELVFLCSEKTRTVNRRAPWRAKKAFPMCCSGPTRARKAPFAWFAAGRASGGNNDTSLAERIETQGEASGLPSTIRIASGGGLERRKLKLSTR